MPIKLFATIGDMSSPPRTRHYLGAGPEQLDVLPDVGLQGGQLMPPARVLILLELEDGFGIWRFANDGTFAGDTWHETLDDAKYQAEFEFGDAKTEWTEIPIDSADPFEYALTHTR